MTITLKQALLGVCKDNPIKVYATEVEDLPKYMKEQRIIVPTLKYYWLAEHTGTYTYGDVGLRVYYLGKYLVGYSSCGWRGGYAPINWVSEKALSEVIKVASEVCTKCEYEPPFFIEDLDRELEPNEHTYEDTLVELNLAEKLL